MELDPMIYKKIIAVILIVLAAWILYVFYNVGREKFIKKFDYIKSKWKIVLFWMILAAIVIVGWYYLSKWGIIDNYLAQ